jgi:hypothetical protein
LWTASATCIASSRVGTSTRPLVWAPAGDRLLDALQHGQRERRRLAGARFGLPQQVLAGEQQRDRFALNRRRFLIAQNRHRVDDLSTKAQCGKTDRRGRRFHRPIMACFETGVPEA